MSQESNSEKQATIMSQLSFDKGNQSYDDAYNQYKQYRQQADDALLKDYGESGTDYANKSRAYGHQVAGETMQRAAAGAQGSTAASARQAGIGEGAAALMGGAAAGNQWMNYDNALNSGIGQYQSAANQFQQQKSAQTGREQNQQNIGASLMGGGLSGMNAVMQQELTGMQKVQNAIGTVAGGLGTAANLAGSIIGISDENAKSDIEETGSDNVSNLLKVYLESRKKEKKNGNS